MDFECFRKHDTNILRLVLEGSTFFSHGANKPYTFFTAATEEKHVQVVCKWSAIAFVTLDVYYL